MFTVRIRGTVGGFFQSKNLEEAIHWSKMKVAEYVISEDKVDASVIIRDRTEKLHYCKIYSVDNGKLSF